MMLTIVLADRSRVRVESCPVPVLIDFPEWRVYAHNVITRGGVDEGCWVATEARTGHSFPGEFSSSDEAALAAMAMLRAWGKKRAAQVFARARRSMARKGIAFPVNDVDAPMPQVRPPVVYGPRTPAPERAGTIWAACRSVLRASDRPMTSREVSAQIPQFTLGQVQQCLADTDRDRRGVVVRTKDGKTARYWLPEMARQHPQFAVGRR